MKLSRRGNRDEELTLRSLLVHRLTDAKKFVLRRASPMPDPDLDSGVAKILRKVERRGRWWREAGVSLALGLASGSLGSAIGQAWQIGDRSLIVAIAIAMICVGIAYALQVWG